MPENPTEEERFDTNPFHLDEKDIKDPEETPELTDTPTPTPEPTDTPTPEPTDTPTPEPTDTPTPTPEPTDTPTPTPEPTETPAVLFAEDQDPDQTGGDPDGSVNIGSEPETAQTSAPTTIQTMPNASEETDGEVAAGGEDQMTASAAQGAPEVITEQLQAAPHNAVMMKKLSSGAASELEDALAKKTEMSPQSLEVYNENTGDEKVNQLQIQDNSEEKEAQKRRILIATAIVCLVLAVAGGAFSYTKYRLLLTRENLRFSLNRIRTYFRGEPGR
jgi:hypothetical protein